MRLQQIDLPAIYLVKKDDIEYTIPLMMNAVEMYLSIYSMYDKACIRMPPDQ